MKLMLPFIVLILCVFAWVDTTAQNCVGDPQFVDSTGFVFPPPYHPVDEPEGGIDAVACIDHYYEFQWTVITPDTVQFPIFPGVNVAVALEYLELETSGAISNLPSGINYLCNPPNCRFNVGEIGCVLLYGTPSANNPPGEYDLAFTGKLKTDLIGIVNVNFPDPNLYPGNYFLTVLDSNDPQCLASTEMPNGLFTTIQLSPNPVTDWTKVSLYSNQATKSQFEVMDMFGRVMRSWDLQIVQGWNEFPLDFSTLVPGTWFYRITDLNQTFTSGKFVKTVW